MRSKAIFIISILYYSVILSCSSQESSIDSKPEAVVTETSDLKVAVQNYKTITHLDVSQKRLNNFPKEIGSFKNLVYLDISKNNIDTIIGNLNKLQKLMHLDLSSNKLRFVPEQIYSLRKLDHLYLYNNRLTTVDDEISGLQQLNQIDLGGNPMAQFPEALVASSSLTSIDLFQTFIREIPKEILEMEQLESLYLPSKISQSSRDIVDSLIAKDMNVQLFSFCEFLAYDAGISRHNATDLEPEIKENIRYLSLSGKNLKSIPEDIDAYKNLEYLDLSQNQISQIDDKLKGLKHLKYLDLSENSITVLPSGRIPNDLLYLDLSWNQFEVIDSERWDKLEYLFLEGNPLTKFICGIHDHLKVLDISFTKLDNVLINTGSESWLVVNSGIKFSSQNEPELVVRRK